MLCSFSLSSPPSLHLSPSVCVSGPDGTAGEAGPNYSEAEEAAEGLLQEDRRDGRYGGHSSVITVCNDTGPCGVVFWQPILVLVS